MGGQRHTPAALPPGDRTGTHCIGGWLGPISGLNGWYIYIYIYIYTHTHTHTECFTTCGHYCMRWFPRSLWSKKFILTCVRFWTVTEFWAFFNSRTCPRVNLATEPAGGWCTQVGGLSLALQALFLPPDSPSQLQTVQFPYHDTWNVFKECGEGGVGGYSPGQCIQHESATTTCSDTLITCITVTVPAPDVQNSTAIVS